MDADNKVKIEGAIDSPTSVLEDEDLGNLANGVKQEDEILQDAKNGDCILISREMEEEEGNLLKARIKEEEVELETKPAVTAHLDESQFTKLDELLTQTKLYSEFLLEKMDDITFNGEEMETKPVEKKRGRGSKRKASANYNNRKAKRAVAAMLTRSQESGKDEDANLTLEERVQKEQRELVPLLTGGHLKSYQLKGVKWLISLWQNGLNGILADQMGLGKTIQTIGFLAHLKGKGLDGPYLVIAPLSTLSNWVNEISRFVPLINAIIYHGDKKQRNEIRKKYMPRTIGPKFPIVVTSYEVAMSDARRSLRHYDWKYLVVDEGHRLKNSKCKLLRELKLLSVENKLLLTGTPLQNNLAELWSLLNFILPDIFSSHEEFESWFDLSGKYSNEEREELVEKQKSQVVAKLHAILRPFLLRRIKSDVENMLPGKKEIIIYANLTEYQKNFQDHLINKSLEQHLTEKASSGHSVRKKLNNLMIQLRKNCNHPDLLESDFDHSYTYPPVEQIVEQCGKFHLLERLLSRLFARNHKILDIMDYYFSEKGFEVCKIDGRVKLDERRRQARHRGWENMARAITSIFSAVCVVSIFLELASSKPSITVGDFSSFVFTYLKSCNNTILIAFMKIQEFNDVNSNYRIFLLSTRAGGLGINLTAADTCILYDSDWNPQMDLQAMDRCHRIGQTKPVHVYRLATAQSVEGRILKRAYSKLKLEHVVIGKGQFHQERTKSSSCDITEEEELLALLKEEENAEDKMIQTDISDEDLERLMDRSDLAVGSAAADATAPNVEEKCNGGWLPLKGPGWEVVIPTATGGVLSTVNS